MEEFVTDPEEAVQFCIMRSVITGAVDLVY
jgi:hypothetical protein